MILAPPEYPMPLMLKIVNGDRVRWRRSEAATPDAALSDLADRGLYDFEAGDTLKRVVYVRDEDHGYSLGEDCNG